MGMKAIAICDQCAVESDHLIDQSVVPRGWIGLDQDVEQEVDRDDGGQYRLVFCSAQCLRTWLAKGHVDA
jgi:hypothetical protein